MDNFGRFRMNLNGVPQMEFKLRILTIISWTMKRDYKFKEF